MRKKEQHFQFDEGGKLYEKPREKKIKKAPEIPSQKQLAKMSVDEIAKLIEQARDAIGEE
jgi:hypothetical protein